MMKYAGRSLLLAALLATVARGEGPADALLKLVAPDAGAVLAVEDLRGHARSVLGSPLVEGLRDLPAVKAGLGGDGLARLGKARRDIEAALGVDISRVRDDLFGDAVVLALQPAPADAGPPRGLLLLRVRDRTLLDRLIAAVNQSDRRNGTLLGIERRTWADTPYSVRTFRPGTKPAEAYAVLGPDTFAWSNSEALIRGAIDRRTAQPGLIDEPRFQAVRAALPSGALASLFVDPRFLERMAAADPRPKPDDPGSALLKRALGATVYAGAALAWHDGPTIHIHQTIDPAKLDESWTSRTARPGGAADVAARVPPTALALVAGRVNLEALAGVVAGLVPEADRARLDNLRLLARGLLLGRDPTTDILKALGPDLLAVVEAPVDAGEPGRLPLALTVRVGDDPGVSAALDNALKTVLAMTALDPKRGNGSARVESRTIRGVSVTTLSGPRPPLAYALGSGRLIVGTTPEVVAGALAAEPGANARFDRFRAAHFPGAENYAYMDIEAMHRWATAHRAELGHRLATGQGGASGRDLDQVLALLGLFRAGFATGAVAPEFTSVHITIGLTARGQGAAR